MIISFKLSGHPYIIFKFIRKMTMKLILSCATLLFISFGSQAAVEATLTYTTPTAVVSATDVIELWGTLSLSATSDPFTYDGSESSPYGIDASIFPTTGNNYSIPLFDEPFDTVSESYLFVSRNCSGNFGNDCDDGEYAIDQGVSTWFNIEQPFTMTAGESRDFLLAVFTPTNGTAAAGDYIFYTAGLGIGIRGLSIDGIELESEVLFQACSSGDESCAFTRTVTAVPLPSAVWFFGIGLLTMLNRKRTSTLALKEI